MKIKIRTTFLILFLTLNLAGFAAAGEHTPMPISNEDLKEGAVVKASCGECQFGMSGTSCDLAVEINGEPYFVVGTDIDSHGDAHASDGFCNAVRHAKVTGEIIDGKFHAKTFELLKEDAGDIGTEG